MKIIIGISGASGAIYGIELLKSLKQAKIETHLIISRTAHITIAQETNYTPQHLHKLADYTYKADDLAACISSGSYETNGMIIAPCSMRSLAEIATGTTSNLLTRSADVCLKERRKLVLMPRETPLHSIHLKNMLTLADIGAIIAPPLPAFYNNPATIDDIVKHSVGRVLDLFGIKIESKNSQNDSQDMVKRWQGIKKPKK